MRNVTILRSGEGLEKWEEEINYFLWREQVYKTTFRVDKVLKEPTKDQVLLSVAVTLKRGKVGIIPKENFTEWIPLSP